MHSVPDMLHAVKVCVLQRCQTAVCQAGAVLACPSSSTWTLHTVVAGTGSIAC